MENTEIIYGRNPVLEHIKDLQQTGNTTLFVAKNAHGKIIETIISTAKSKKINVVHKEKKLLDDIAQSNKHQGIVLQTASAFIIRNDSNLLQRLKAENGMIVVLDHLTDPHNVGSIIRSAEALGARAVILPKANSSGITSTVIKTAAGATAHIEISIVSNIVQFLNKAKEQGFWIIGSSDHGIHTISEIKEIKPKVLVIGSEGEGLKHLTEKTCDFIVKIPLHGKTNSLNASVAAGILIYELMKS